MPDRGVMNLSAYMAAPLREQRAHAEDIEVSLIVLEERVPLTGR